MTPEMAGLVFRERERPVAGDMRIAWRLGVTLLSLLYSRGNKASFAKLHMLNDSLRSDASKQKISAMLNGQSPYVSWRMRVEPAYSRNLDFVVGEGFANWSVSGGKTSLVLTEDGLAAAQSVDREDAVFVDEKAFLSTVGRRMTERFVQSVILAGKTLL